MGKFDFTEIRFFPAAKSGLPSRFDFSCTRSSSSPTDVHTQGGTEEPLILTMAIITALLQEHQHHIIDM